jgi:hypothetical protein
MLNKISPQPDREKAIINGIADALMLLDARTLEILEVNRSFLDDYKMTREEVLGKTGFQDFVESS